MPLLSLEVDAGDLDLNYPLVDKGIYPATVKFQELVKSKKGNDMLVFRLINQEPVPAVSTDPKTGNREPRTLPAGKEFATLRCVLMAGPALRNLIELKNATGADAGVTIADAGNGKKRVLLESKERLAEFNGCPVQVVIGHQPSDDGSKTYAQVEHVLAPA